ncbi:FAD-dependent oxidoreductase [soil metagenome]
MADPVWERGGWAGCAPLRGDVAADVCVVGLGGSGLSAIHELLDGGARVVGIDAAGIASGAAGRNGGFLLAGTYVFYHDAVAQYGRDRALAIYRSTLDELDRIERDTPAAVRRVGSLRLATSPEEELDCAAQFDAMRADGLPVKWHDDEAGRGLLIPTDAAFDPLLRCRVLAERAVERGAVLHEHSAALAIDGGRVATSHGSVRCERVIVAVDGALPRVLPELAPRVRAARLQMLATAPAEDVRIPRPVYARYGYEYWQQLPDGRIALGGFRDLGGDGEWTDSTEPTSQIQAALERHLREVVGTRAPVTHRWAASVGYTADGLPVCEEVRPGVWAVGGYSGTGNVVGAMCGRAAAHQSRSWFSRRA